jgi:hypothetical protein
MAGKQLRQSSLDLLLHTGAGLLDLPAFVASAVVSDGELEFQGIHYGCHYALAKGDKRQPRGPHVATLREQRCDQVVVG